MAARDGHEDNNIEYNIDNFNFLPTIQIGLFNTNINATTFERLKELDVFEGEVPILYKR